MEELKNSLIAVLNGSPLPLDAKFYIIKDLYRDMNELYYSELNKLKGSEKNESGMAATSTLDVDKQAEYKHSAESDES